MAGLVLGVGASLLPSVLANLNEKDKKSLLDLAMEKQKKTDPWNNMNQAKEMFEKLIVDVKNAPSGENVINWYTEDQKKKMKEIERKYREEQENRDRNSYKRQARVFGYNPNQNPLESYYLTNAPPEDPLKLYYSAKSAKIHHRKPAAKKQRKSRRTKHKYSLRSNSCRRLKSSVCRRHLFV